ncbi:hypothetical protein SNE40_014294 [Patella caerulea]|uniref:Uncharacterized protein n=1 Tax=Patella caerulea TaxID=87958 RepID=A0AAN8PH21_PATCE
MDDLAKTLWEWCIDRNIFLSASFIPGVLNVSADFASRNFSDSTEWMLKSSIFDRICSAYFTPDIDLFASSLNCQLDNFATWFPQPGALFINAFSVSWTNLEPYLFPPFRIISRVFNKILEGNVQRAILIIPHWPSQAWFTQLMSCIVSHPIRLPRHTDLLTLSHSGQLQPLAKSMDLAATMISAYSCAVEDYHSKLSPQSLIPGDPVVANNMIWPGKGSTYGVLYG